MTLPRLEEIHIRNYKSVEKADLTDIPNLAVFVGRNNAGKSNIVDALLFLSECQRNTQTAVQRRGAEVRDLLWRKKTEKQAEIELVLRFDPTARMELLGLLYGGSKVHIQAVLDSSLLRQARLKIIIGVSQSQLLVSYSNVGTLNDLVPILETSFTPNGYTSTNFQLQPNPQQAPPGVPIESRRGGGASGGGGGLSFTLGERQSTDVPSRILNDFRDLLLSVRWISPVRRSAAKRVIEGQTELDSEAANLVDVLHSLRNNLPTKFNEIAAEVRGLVPSLGNFLTPTTGNQVTLSAGEPGENEALQYTLEQLSAGTRTLVAIVTQVVSAADGSIIVVEEPEAHLHPEAQSGLFQFLERQSTGKTILVVTHSALFASLAPIKSVWLATRDEGNSTVTSRVEEGAVGRIIEELGVRASYSFDADALVFVEGRNDLPIYKAWARQFWESRRVQFIETGGWTNMQYFANAMILSRLTPRRPVFVIIDGDTARGEQSARLRDRVLTSLQVPAENQLRLSESEVEGLLLDKTAIVAAFPESQLSSEQVEALIRDVSRKRDQKGLLQRLFEVLRLDSYTPDRGARIASAQVPPPAEIQQFFGQIKSKLS